MKNLIIFTLLLLTVLNCYLTDLDEYKYLEKHDDHIYKTSDAAGYYLDYNDSICHLIGFKFDFSIKRTVYFDFFENDFKAINKTPVFGIRCENGKTFSTDDHYFRTQLVYDPSICADYFLIRVRAISDIDTIQEYFSSRAIMNLYCDKGEVDSTAIRLQFGKDSTMLSYIITGDYISNPLASSERSLVIVTKFSQSFNKPYIMILDTTHAAVESPYNFISPQNMDTLTAHSKFYNLAYFFDDYTLLKSTVSQSYESQNQSGLNNSFQNNLVDREFFSNILKQKPQLYHSQLCAISKGKQYLLVYSTPLQDKYYCFLLKVRDIVYKENDYTGYADCMLYSLN